MIFSRLYRQHADRMINSHVSHIVAQTTGWFYIEQGAVDYRFLRHVTLLNVYSADDVRTAAICCRR